MSDNIYNSVFANLPIALEHPGKLVSPCWFGPAYKSGVQEPAVAPAHRAPEAVLQTRVQEVPVAAPPIVHGELIGGVPLVGSSGSSSAAPDAPTKIGLATA